MRIIYIYNLVIAILTTLFFITSCTEKKKPNFKKKNNQKNVLPPSFNADSAYFFVKKQVDFGPSVLSSLAWKNCSDWLVKKPKTLSLKHSMTIGTAGLTAMLCIMELENAGISPEKGEVLVTGASGGVGNISVMLLNKLGYSVTAVTGRTELESYLKDIGATNIISRNEILEMTRPLNSVKWAGAIDSTGGEILSNLISAIDFEGPVACCGNAAGIKLSTTVIPLIIRGIKLLGVNSVQCPTEKRVIAWQRLSDLISSNEFEEITQEITLNDIYAAANDILGGQIKGRTIINISASENDSYEEIFKGY